MRYPKWACSTTALAMALSATAAQAEPVEKIATVVPAAQTSPAVPETPSSDPEDRTGGIDDIIVTAQRRSESLQRAAMAISVVGGDDLTNRGITNPDGLTRLVPALQVTPTGGTGINLYVRGVGARVTNAATENAIAFSVDGVFISRPGGTAGNFYDLERVEVLKGPQGTLYGRNSTGGAINLVTRRPVIGDAGGEMAFEVGNYSNLRVNAAVNVPLGDTLAARVAAQVIKRDGYLSQGYDDEVGQAIRGQLLFQPSDRFSLLVSGDYFNAGGKGPGSVIVPTARVPLAPALDDRISGADPISVAALRAAFPAQFNAGVVIPPQTDGYSRGEFWGVSASAEVDLGFARLTVLPAFRRAGSSLLNYRPGFPVDNSEQSDQVTVETRLASQGDGPLTYVAGLFFYDQRQDARILNIVSSAQQTNSLFDISTRSYAAFGQATYAIVDGVRLVGGVRYTTETKRQDLLSRNPTPANPSPPFNPITGRVEFDKVTWKAGVEADPRPGSLLYANVATGFKSGGLQTTRVGSYAPETLTAYTVGSKNRFLDNRLQVNLEAFYWQYRDQQQNVLTPIPSTTTPGTFVTANITQNVGAARMYGLDADIRVALSNRITLSTSVQYLNAKYTDFRYDAVSASGAAPVIGCPTALNTAIATVAPARVFTVNCSGSSTLNAPKWAFTVGYEHVVPVSSALELVANLDGAYQSSRYLEVEYLPEQLQRPAFLADATLTLRKSGGAWSVTAWMNNITDREIKNQAFNRPVLNVVYAGLRPPRTYGVRTAFRF